jgi:hypothetical protein
MPLLPGNLAVEESFVTSLKYIAPIGALLCCTAGWFSQKTEN